MQTWMCLICGWIYDEAQGCPEEGIAPGTKWADVPPNWVCPECGARKEDFEMMAVLSHERLNGFVGAFFDGHARLC